MVPGRISIDISFNSCVHTYPPNGGKNRGENDLTSNCGQTVTDIAKLCIEVYSEVVGELLTSIC